LQQAIKLLQLTRLELQDVVQTELVDNPVLEEASEEKTTQTDAEEDGRGEQGNGKDNQFEAEQSTDKTEEVGTKEGDLTEPNDFDWENPNLEGLWEMTAKYGIPYFSNFINSDMKPEDTRSMCCRLRLELSELDKRGGGLFGANALTGSVGVVTINLPRLGYKALHNKQKFWDIQNTT